MLRLFARLNIETSIASSCKCNILNSSNAISPQFARSLTDKVSDLKKPTDDDTKKKKKAVQYISLIGTDQIMTLTTLDEATKLSNRRNLKLVKKSDYDYKRKCPVYQLFTGAQYLNEDIKFKKATKQESTGFKSEKIITFSHKIFRNDVESKVKQILKWIQKDHQVRVTVTGGDVQDGQTEKIYSQIENLIGKQARILQKRNSSNDIKFQVIPLKKEKTKTPSKDENVLSEPEKGEAAASTTLNEVTST